MNTLRWASLCVVGSLAVLCPVPLAADDFTYQGMRVGAVGEIYHVPGWPRGCRVIAWNYDSRWHHALQNARLEAGTWEKAQTGETYARAVASLEAGRLAEYPNELPAKAKLKMLAQETAWLEARKLASIGVESQRVVDELARKAKQRGK